MYGKMFCYPALPPQSFFLLQERETFLENDFLSFSFLLLIFRGGGGGNGREKQGWVSSLVTKRCIKQQSLGFRAISFLGLMVSHVDFLSHFASRTLNSFLNNEENDTMFVYPVSSYLTAHRRDGGVVLSSTTTSIPIGCVFSLSAVVPA